MIPSLPKQNTIEAEAGYHFTSAKLTPWVNYETRSYDDAVKSPTFLDERRFQVGGTWYAVGNTMNLKAGHDVTRFGRELALWQHGFTVQVQAYYF